MLQEIRPLREQWMRAVHMCRRACSKCFVVRMSRDEALARRINRSESAADG